MASTCVGTAGFEPTTPCLATAAAPSLSSLAAKWSLDLHRAGGALVSSCHWSWSVRTGFSGGKRGQLSGPAHACTALPTTVVSCTRT